MPLCIDVRELFSCKEYCIGWREIVSEHWSLPTLSVAAHSAQHTRRPLSLRTVSNRASLTDVANHVMECDRTWWQLHAKSICLLGVSSSHLSCCHVLPGTPSRGSSFTDCYNSRCCISSRLLYQLYHSQQPGFQGHRTEHSTQQETRQLLEYMSMLLAERPLSPMRHLCHTCDEQGPSFGSCNISERHRWSLPVNPLIAGLHINEVSQAAHCSHCSERQPSRSELALECTTRWLCVPCISWQTPLRSNVGELRQWMAHAQRIQLLSSQQAQYTFSLYKLPDLKLSAESKARHGPLSQHLLHACMATRACKQAPALQQKTHTKSAAHRCCACSTWPATSMNASKEQNPLRTHLWPPHLVAPPTTGARVLFIEGAHTALGPPP